MKRYALHCAVPDNATMAQATAAMLEAMKNIKESTELGFMPEFEVDFEVYEAEPPAGYSVSFNRYE